MPPYPGFIGPTYRSQSPYLIDDRCINFYVEQIEIGNPKSPLALYPRPGLRPFAQPTLNPCRASFHQDGRAFFVIGYAFVEVLSDGTLTQHGTVEVNDNPATISSSGDAGHQLMITSGRRVYIFNLLTDTWDEVADVDADMGGYLDGRFMVLDAELSIFRISEVDDGLTWNPLRYRLRSKAPDKWKAMIVANDAIWLMGSETYEVWYNDGGSPFPFSPVQGALYQVGIGSPFSLKDIGGAVHWVTSNKDGDGQVMQAVQYEPKRISNHSIEYNLQRMDGLASCEAMTYQMYGHNFYVLTSREDNQTWVYDMTSSMWTENLDWEISNVRPARWVAWRPMYHAFAFGKHLVGDRANGIIHEMDPTCYTDVNEAAIRRVRRAPHLSFENKVLRYRALELDIQPGIGDGDPDSLGYDPKVMLRYSNNGGMTWGNELSASAGKRGEYSKRIKFNRLGASRNRVFEMVMTDPAPWRVLNAYLSL